MSRARTRRIRCSSGSGPTCGPCSSTTVCAPGRRRPGTAAANLLEAEVVTPDGAVRTANAASNPDLFWALKGGAGGTFGAVTRLTLRTHATLAGQVRQLATHRYLAIPAMASRRMSVALPTRRKTAQPHHRYLSR